PPRRRTKMRIRTVLTAVAASWVAISSPSPAQTDPSKPAKTPAMSEQPKAMAEKAAAMTASTSSRVVSTEDAPKAAGPYSQAVVAGGFLFAAGQVPRDPRTNQFVVGTIEVSTER